MSETVDPAAIRALSDQWLSNVGPLVDTLAEYHTKLRHAGLPPEVANTLVLDAASLFNMRPNPMGEIGKLFGG